MEAQFDVYRLADQTLVVLLQNDIVDVFRTRLVAPLVSVKKAGRVIRGLNPVIQIGQQDFVLMPQLLAAVPITELGKHVGSVTHLRDEIIRALDLLFTGF
jgi:toxin CcdB